MVVKEKRGRRRYIAFEVDRRVSDEDMLTVLATLQAQGVKGKMIQFNGVRGIFRCRPQDKDRALALLASRSPDQFALRTLSTSGTLRTLREKYFQLEDGHQ